MKTKIIVLFFFITDILTGSNLSYVADPPRGFAFTLTIALSLAVARDL